MSESSRSSSRSPEIGITTSSSGSSSPPPPPPPPTPPSKRMELNVKTSLPVRGKGSPKLSPVTKSPRSSQRSPPMVPSSPSGRAIKGFSFIRNHLSTASPIRRSRSPMSGKKTVNDGDSDPPSLTLGVRVKEKVPFKSLKEDKSGVTHRPTPINQPKSKPEPASPAIRAPRSLFSRSPASNGPTKTSTALRSLSAPARRSRKSESDAKLSPNPTRHSSKKQPMRKSMGSADQGSPKSPTSPKSLAQIIDEERKGSNSSFDSSSTSGSFTDQSSPISRREESNSSQEPMGKPPVAVVEKNVHVKQDDPVGDALAEIRRNNLKLRIQKEKQLAEEKRRQEEIEKKAAKQAKLSQAVDPADGNKEGQEEEKASGVLSPVRSSTEIIALLEAKRASATTGSEVKELTPSQLNHLSCVVDGLFIGDIEAAVSAEMLTAAGITHIVDLSNSFVDENTELARSRPARNVNYEVAGSEGNWLIELPMLMSKLVVRVDDVDNAPLAEHFDDINSYITKVIDGGGAVLVHCFRGKSRSATAVVQFLMQQRGMTLKEAMSKTKKARPVIDINVTFRKALMDLEAILRPGEEPSVQLKLKSRKPVLSSANRPRSKSVPKRA